jgi:predicted regulator of Ras-like GTPase activity (Roadblock/LC7/MglB family)
MFEQQFTRLLESLPDLRAVAVVGDDGIEIESTVREDEVPHEVLSAEMNGILKTLQRLRSELALGPLNEFIVRTESQNVILFALSEGLFILLVTTPSEATGKTRFEVQRIAHQFQDALK